MFFNGNIFCLIFFFFFLFVFLMFFFFLFVSYSSALLCICYMIILFSIHFIIIIFTFSYDGWLIYTTEYNFMLYMLTVSAYQSCLAHHRLKLLSGSKSSQHPSHRFIWCICFIDLSCNLTFLSDTACLAVDVAG